MSDTHSPPEFAGPEPDGSKLDDNDRLGSPPIIDHEPPLRVAGAPPPLVARERRRGGTPFLLTLLLTAALGGGLYWVWANPRDVPQTSLSGQQPAAQAADTQLTGRVDVAAQQLQTLSGRVDALEKRPAAPDAAPPPTVGSGATTPPVATQDSVADLAKKVDDLSGRLDGLSAKQDAQAAALAKAGELANQKTTDASSASPPPDTTAQQVPGLIAGQQAADLGNRLDQQKTAFDQTLTEQKTAAEQVAAQQKATLDALQQRLATLELAKTQDTNAADAKAAVAALDGRVGKLEQGAGQAAGVAKDASRAIRVEAAETALAAGQKLGPLPDAPPALTRYTDTAPPTEAGLRADFSRVAEAARVASQPDISSRSFLDRALARVQQSVTVRRGNRVIVGDPAAGVLARAQDSVNAGDLAGAATTLGELRGAAQDAVHDWVDQVHALLAARAALAAMAHG